jgi:LmbE family N-acetylglucosaminyl deacetylase
MNPYRQFVSDFANLFAAGKQLPLGNLAPAPKIQRATDAPVALIFSPHPDDECIIGGLALRLLREAGMRIVNVAVTHGSNQERQQPRLHELKNACAWLGFELEQTAPNGLEKINLQSRTQDPQHWETAVQVIAASLAKNKPRVIFFPHELDWNATHIGTHWLVMDALKTLPADFQTSLIETEFWGQMASPNLIVELGANEVADLMAALSCHIGEVRRNPYHLRMPAWLQDNVRRGAELVGGQGGVAPDFLFATLYRARKWQNGQVKELFPGGRQLSAKDVDGI